LSSLLHEKEQQDMAGQPATDISALRASGQMWKFLLANSAMLIGSFAPFWPETGLTWTTGTVLAVAGYAFGCLYIRCPSCCKRWFWEAAMQPELYGPLFKKSACPLCQHDCNAPTGERAAARR
jgi:hypothetical protein